MSLSASETSPYCVFPALPARGRPQARGGVRYWEEQVHDDIVRMLELDPPALRAELVKVCAPYIQDLVICGEGALRDGLARQIADLGLGAVVHLPGFVADPLPLMSRCDVFVLSSRWEGLGNVLVEAGALGTPLVSTDCPTGPREVLSDRPGTELVAPDDAVAMAEAISRALEAGRRPPELDRWAEHSVAASAAGYERVINSVR